MIYMKYMYSLIVFTFLLQLWMESSFVYIHIRVSKCLYTYIIHHIFVFPTTLHIIYSGSLFNVYFDIEKKKREIRAAKKREKRNNVSLLLLVLKKRNTKFGAAASIYIPPVGCGDALRPAPSLSGRSPASFLYSLSLSYFRGEIKKKHVS